MEHRQRVESEKNYSTEYEKRRKLRIGVPTHQPKFETHAGKPRTRSVAPVSNSVIGCARRRELEKSAAYFIESRKRITGCSNLRGMMKRE